MTARRTANDAKATPTWCYDEGVLTIRHSGREVSLGRYATREHAAKAAAAYFAKHGAGSER
jgi:hypothetical protein